MGKITVAAADAFSDAFADGLKRKEQAMDLDGIGTLPYGLHGQELAAVNTHDEWLWTDWTGGKCPVTAQTDVKLEFEDGEFEEGKAGVFEEDLCWKLSTNLSQYRIKRFAVRNPAFAHAPVDHLALLRQCGEALERAKMFIENGVELGFIQLPTSPDPALETPAKIAAAIEALRKAGVSHD